MFTLAFLILFCGTHINVHCNNLNENSAVLAAILQVIDQHFVRHEYSFNIAYYGNSSNELQDLVSRIAKNSSAVKSFRVAYEKNETAFDRNLAENTIHLFGSLNSFKIAALSSNLSQINNPQTKHVIFIKNATAQDIAWLQSKKYCEVQINFLFDANEVAVELSTMYYYTQKFCGLITLEVVNTFSKRKGKWTTREFFPKKHRNFHGCQINVVYGTDPPRSFLSVDNKPDGFNVDVIKIIAKLFNFTLNFIHWDSYFTLQRTNKTTGQQMDIYLRSYTGLKLNDVRN